MITITAPKFQIGQVVITPGAKSTFEDEFVAKCLVRHATGDWGDLGKTDNAANERALKTGARLMSVYTNDTDKMYIITEADRSVTTILLPEEY